MVHSQKKRSLRRQIISEMSEIRQFVFSAVAFIWRSSSLLYYSATPVHSPVSRKVKVIVMFLSRADFFFGATSELRNKQFFL